MERVGVLAGTSAVLVAGGVWLHGDEPVRHRQVDVLKLKDFRVPPNTLFPAMAVVHGQNVENMAREAVAKLGGMARFIQKGDRVLLKPNVGWDRMPEQAANTGPDLVLAVARLCQEAQAATVWVTDVSLNDPARCFFRSGIENAAQQANAQLFLPGKNDFLPTDMGGVLLKVWPVNRLFHKVDKVINLPIVKHHSLSGCTLAMKNWYGVIGGRRNQLHQDIHTSICDLAAAVRPTLTVMDAVRVLKANGPTGGSLEDVQRENTLIAALDEVALDSYCLGYLGLRPEQIAFLALAEGRGLGKVRWQDLNVSETQV
ncbi:MAG: protein of unknown function DUF362 [Magnetococcales bacterium]|nr:protein of unknown function DUF362 [Magnetococcales bacterium]HIJ84319.1 DUF362 domain-containing protein [Magnetococcales bacterium]